MDSSSGSPDGERREDLRTQAERYRPGGNLPTQLRWLRYLDDEDRAACLAELWEALEDEHSEGTQEAFDKALHAWRTTALALADPDRREVLLGTVDIDDFQPVARPQ